VLNAEQLSHICGVAPYQRRDWATEGDLRAAHPGFDERDAIELAVYARLRQVAKPKRGKAAWRQLRPGLASLLLDPPSRLWAVIEATPTGSALLADTAVGLARVVETGVLVYVVELRRVIDEARARYRAAVGQGSEAAGGPERYPSFRGARRARRQLRHSPGCLPAASDGGARRRRHACDPAARL
jgi:hypothetical protein